MKFSQQFFFCRKFVAKIFPNEWKFLQKIATWSFATILVWRLYFNFLQHFRGNPIETRVLNMTKGSAEILVVLDQHGRAAISIPPGSPFQPLNPCQPSAFQPIPAKSSSSPPILASPLHSNQFQPSPVHPHQSWPTNLSFIKIVFQFNNLIPAMVKFILTNLSQAQ